MRFKTVLAALCAFLCFFAVESRAQVSNDPADSFLTLWQHYQKGEALEKSNNFPAALQTFREVGGMIDELVRHFPDWSPTVVDFRRKKTLEAISRMEEKITATGGIVPPPGAPVNIVTEPAIPSVPSRAPVAINGEEPRYQEPTTLDTGSPLVPDLPRKGSRDVTSSSSGGDPFKEIQIQREKMQRELRDAQDELEKTRREQADLKRQLENANKNLADAESRQKVLKQRADTTEEALMKAKSQGTESSEQIKVQEQLLKKLKADIVNIRYEKEAAEEVRQQIAERNLAMATRAGNLFKENKEAVANSAKANDIAAKAEQVAQKRVDEAEKRASEAIQAAEKRVAEVMKESEDLKTQLATITKQRDDAVEQVGKLREGQKQVAALMDENAKLVARVADAEKQIAQYKAESDSKDQIIASLKTEITSVKQQLADTQKQNAAFQTEMVALNTKLTDTSKALEILKADSTTAAAEKKQMQEENQLLLGVVKRSMTREAQLSLTRKTVLEQMQKLNIKSQDLRRQLELLGQKTLVLTPKEKAFFRKQKIDLVDVDTAVVAPPQPAEAAVPPLPTAEPVEVASNNVPPKSAVPAPEAAPAPAPAPEAAPAPAPEVPTPAPAPAPTATEGQPKEAKAPAIASAPPKPESTEPPALSLQLPGTDNISVGNPPPAVAEAPAPASAPTGDDLPGAPTGENSAVASMTREMAKLPPDLLAFVQEGKEQYERGNYKEAEQAYVRVLAKAPTNLYALSNLGVVRFRANKLELAAESFRKAIAIAPEDGFSHCKLGAVYYSQGKYDEAVVHLTRALAIDPKDSVAHNYLGITASQKGWPEAALKELDTAVALDPNNADAHFNLAVVLATCKPPNKEKARENYKKAIELGSDPDTSLEAMLK